MAEGAAREGAPGRQPRDPAVTTIMTVGNSEGSRRCNARCHTATSPECDCVCGGRYHGRGSSAAAQEQLTRDWLGDELTDAFKAAVTPEEKARPQLLAQQTLLSLGGEVGAAS